MYFQINLISTYYISKKKWNKNNDIIYRGKIKQSLKNKRTKRHRIRAKFSSTPFTRFQLSIVTNTAHSPSEEQERKLVEEVVSSRLLSGIGKNKRETGRKSKVYRRILGRSRFKPDSRGIRASWRPGIKNGAGSSLRKTVRGPRLSLSLFLSLSLSLFLVRFISIPPS